MREMFKTRAISAGFPEGLFSFHSLRAGFLCSAILKAGCNPEELKAILETTAHVAGWVPNQAAQMRYVKTCAKKTIVASRLLMPEEEGLSLNIVDRMLTNSEAFHNIVLAEPYWDPAIVYSLFFKAIEKKFTNESLSQSDSDSLKKKCWRNSFRSFVLRRPELEAEARIIYQAKPEWSISRTRCSVECCARMLVGRRHIIQLLQSNSIQIEELISEFEHSVQEEFTMVKPLIRNTIKEKVPVIQIREVFESGSRKRKTWTSDEDAILVSHKQRNSTWVDIAKLLMDRTNVDCKDRWRNLQKRMNMPE